VEDFPRVVPTKLIITRIGNPHILRMEPLSLAAGCVALVGTVAKVSIQIRSFVQDVREAKCDLDAVRRELDFITGILEQIQAKGAEQTLPERLYCSVSGIVESCGHIIDQVENLLFKYSRRGIKDVVWAHSGQVDMNRLRCSLSAHKSSLGIALDFLNLYVNSSRIFQPELMV
jgi:hypothetical protein